MERKIKILPPKMPNFILMDFEPGSTITQPSIPITNLSEEEAQEFAEMMREEFLKHYKTSKSKIWDGNQDG